MSRSVETLVRDHIEAIYSTQEPLTAEEIQSLVRTHQSDFVPTRKSVRRGSAVAIAVAAIVLAIGLIPQFFRSGGQPLGPATIVSTTVADTTLGTGPSDADPRGLPGLPPEGTPRSSPETGELVASMWEHIGAPGSFGNGWLYLFADGRLIWEQLDPDPAGGWLEQRLTPEGVELVRSEIIATGLFDPNQPAPPPSGGFPRETKGGYVQVRNGDQLVYVNRVVPDLHERLAQLWSWLPEDAWVDQEAKAYVPSRYAVCVHQGGYVNPADATGHLAGLPASAQDLLATARGLEMAALVEVDPAGLEFAGDESCFDIRTEEARALAGILEAAGSEELPHRSYDGSELTYVISRDGESSTGLGFNGITLTLWPMLPHGVPAFTGA